MGGKPCRVALHAPKRGNQQMQPADQAQQDCWCGDPMIDRQSVRLSCKHTMHRDCWQGWQRSRHEMLMPSTCPLCREEIGAPPEDMSPAEESAARARRYGVNVGAYDVSAAHRALMWLKRRAGEAAGATTADQAAMVRLVSVLPPALVTDIAAGEGPEDLEGAIRDALERVVASPGQVDPRIAEALRGGRLIPMLARAIGTRHQEQRQDHFDFGGSDSESEPEDGAVDELARRILERFGRSRQGRQRARWMYQLLDQTMPMDLAEALVNRTISYPQAAVRVWLAAAGLGQGVPVGSDVGEALMRRDDLRDTIRVMVESGSADRVSAARLRELAPRVRDFVDATLARAGDTYVYEPPRREQEAFVSRLMSSASTEGVDERVRDEVAPVLRALGRSWTERGEREIAGIVRHPEQLAVQTLAAMVRNSWDARAPAMVGLLQRLDRLSVRRAGMLGESLLRGEGLASLQLSAEETALLRGMRFPAALFEGVVLVLQRALAGVE